MWRLRRPVTLPGKIPKTPLLLVLNHLQLSPPLASLNQSLFRCYRKAGRDVSLAPWLPVRKENIIEMA